MDTKKNIIKPTECKIGTELLHGFPKEFPFYKYQSKSNYEMKDIINAIYDGAIDKIPYEILNAIVDDRTRFTRMFLENKHKPLNQNGKLFFQSLYYLFKSVESVVNITMEQFPNIALEGTKNITDIKYLYENYDDL